MEGALGLIETAATLLTSAERALLEDGSLHTSRQLYDAAFRSAEVDGNADEMARAALGLGGLWVHEHRSVSAAALVYGRQRQALALVPSNSALALRLRIRLAGEADYRAGGHGDIFGLLDDARRSGDAAVWAEALSLAHHCVLGPGQGDLRRRLAEELLDVATTSGRRIDRLMGLLWRTVDLYLDDDPHAGRCFGELRTALSGDGHLAVGFVARAIEVMLTIRAGRFDDAEVLARDTAERGAEAGDIDATGWHGAQMVATRWYQGRIAELVPMLHELVHSPTLSAVDNSYFAALAVASASAGDRRQATAALARLRGRDLAELPRSSSWLVLMNGVVEAANLLDDRDTAARAYTLLSPYGQLPMMASLGVACFGSTQHALGVAALTTGDLDRAVQHLHTAIHRNLAIGHWPAATLSRWRLGRALALRDGSDNAAARRELMTAAQEAAGLAMRLPDDPRVERIALSDDVLPTGFGEEQRRVLCRRRGQQWRLELGRRSVHVAHSVGMVHLATLLANPGYEILAVDLVANAGVAAPAITASSQSVLDEVAKREYRQRLARLQAEIDEFDSMNEPEGAAQLRAERDWLVAELAAATGVGGRSRQFAGSEERARIAVGKAIRRAIARVNDADPVIGEELRATIQTGLRCCYRPS